MAKRNPRLVVGAAIAVFVLAVGSMVMRLGSSSRTAGAGELWYYDLQTGELFTAEATSPPIAAPSGAHGARAHVYACGACDDPASRFTAYIEIYSDEVKAFLDGKTSEVIDIDAGRLVAEPSTDPQWVAHLDARGMQLKDAVQTRCADAIECLP